MIEEIKSYKFKLDLQQEFEILPIKDLYIKCGKMMMMTIPPRTDFYQILWFIKGNLTHLIDFEPVNIAPNTVLFLNKSIVQKFDKRGDPQGYAILFTENFFCQTQDDIKFLRDCMIFFPFQK